MANQFADTEDREVANFIILYFHLIFKPEAKGAKYDGILLDLNKAHDEVEPSIRRRISRS